jgi:hypothetical protein
MTTFDQIASKIIKEQELIMGPLAWDEAASVKGLTIVNKESGEVVIDANIDHGMVIDQLVNKYVELFGRAAREACREAAVALVADLPLSEVPSSLK